MHLLARFDKHGNLVFSSSKVQAKFERFKQFYVDNGQYFSLTLNDVQKQSTEAQHALFHRICHMIAYEAGDDFIDIKKTMENDCLPIVATGNTDLLGDPVIERKSLKDLDTKEFNVFLEKVIQIGNAMFNMGLEIHTSEEFGNKVISNKK